MFLDLCQQKRLIPKKKILIPANLNKPDILSIIDEATSGNINDTERETFSKQLKA